MLTVTNDRGDYLLDNLNKNILLWSTTDYRLVKRQSQANPNGWVSLVRQPPTVTAASNSLAQSRGMTVAASNRRRRYINDEIPQALDVR